METTPMPPIDEDDEDGGGIGFRNVDEDRPQDEPGGQGDDPAPGPGRENGS